MVHGNSEGPQSSGSRERRVIRAPVPNGVKFSTKGGNKMSLENITVNGKPLKQHVEEEKSNEIQQFLAFEIRSMRRSSRHHIMSRPAAQTSRKVEQLGNGSIRVK